MRERIELLGGKFQVGSMEGRGTRVVLEVPIESRVSERAVEVERRG